jgi:hypothetical protein
MQSSGEKVRRASRKPERGFLGIPEPALIITTVVSHMYFF